jgi:hypothetical protein
MKITILTLIFTCLSVLTGVAQKNIAFNSEMYGTGEWDEDSLGNHRVLVEVESESDVVWAHIVWRRRDLNPEEKGIIIVDASTRKIIENVLPLTINREFGDILFQPKTTPGKYYVYYLKHFMHGRSNYPTVTYPKFDSKADVSWLSKAKPLANNLSKIPQVKLVQFQSIDKFNTFFPMELIATVEEVANLIKNNSGSDYLVFPESRENSIRMTNDIPIKWIHDGVTNTFSGKALKGEYFTFQLGLYAAQMDIENIEVEFSGLKNLGKTVIDGSAFTSFNTSGIDWEGKSFVKKFIVETGKVQALWIGVQVPENIDQGTYDGIISVQPANSTRTDVQIKLEVTGWKDNCSRR